MVQGTNDSGSNRKPKMEPNPRISLHMAIVMRTIINPNPVVNPSQKERIGLLDCAKASARPMMMQLVIMRPTYGPSALLMSGRKARRTMSTKITKKEITKV